MQHQEEQNLRLETMMHTVLEENQREDREEWQKDRDFFLELGKLFANNN